MKCSSACSHMLNYVNIWGGGIQCSSLQFSLLKVFRLLPPPPRHLCVLFQRFHLPTNFIRVENSINIKLSTCFMVKNLDFKEKKILLLLLIVAVIRVVVTSQRATSCPRWQIKAEVVPSITENTRGQPEEVNQQSQSMSCVIE